jgi:hypothetical protein
MHVKGVQKIAAGRSASDARAKHTDAKCLAKSALTLTKDTVSCPNDVIDRQSDAQAMQ